jgi:hypothetical protein
MTWFSSKPPSFTEIGGARRMGRSKQLDYELESKRRAEAAQGQSSPSILNLRNATNLLRIAHLQHALGGEIS